jgi:hypothetical protein
MTCTGCQAYSTTGHNALLQVRRTCASDCCTSNEVQQGSQSGTTAHYCLLPEVPTLDPSMLTLTCHDGSNQACPAMLVACKQSCCPHSNLKRHILLHSTLAPSSQGMPQTGATGPKQHSLVQHHMHAKRATGLLSNTLQQGTGARTGPKESLLQDWFYTPQTTSSAAEPPTAAANQLHQNAATPLQLPETEVTRSRCCIKCC